MSFNDPYLVMGTDGVLINLLGVRDSGELKLRESELRRRNWCESIHSFSVSLDGLRLCHRHIFDSIYPWAGFFIFETIPYNGGTIDPLEVTLFSHSSSKSRKSASELRDVFGANFCEIARKCSQLRWGDQQAFLHSAREIFLRIIDDHPFRDGNTITAHIFIRELGRTLGFLYEPGYSDSNDSSAALRENWKRVLRYVENNFRTKLIEDKVEEAIEQSLLQTPSRITRFMRRFSR